MKFIANSHQQTLLAHTQQVTHIATSIFQTLHLQFEDSLNNDMVNKAIEIAGQCHDLGKLCVDFQTYLQQDKAYQSDIGEGELFSAKNPLHHEISLLLFDVLWADLKETIEPKVLRQVKHRQLREMIRYGIYWHHAEPVRDNDPAQILQEYVEDNDVLSALAENTTHFFGHLYPELDLNITEDDILDAVDQFKVPSFFTLSTSDKGEYTQWRKRFIEKLDNNVYNFLTRFCVIASDRHVSQLDAADIEAPYRYHQFDDTALTQAITQYINHPDLSGKRTEDQKQAAHELIDYDSNVIVGAAGCGKTRTALMAYQYQRDAEGEHKGILWVCPRVAVGLSVLEEIKESVPEVKVGLISGELKGVWQGDKEIDLSPLEADILIVTVDQVAKWLTTNSAQPNFIAFMQRYVVWDEYHELFAIQTLYYISAVLMRLKEHQVNSHVFISATPEPLHLRLICRSDASWQFPVVLPSFNTKPVHLHFKTEAETNNPATLYIFNTATKAQEHALESWLSEREDIACYHSKFMPSDKKQLTHAILAQFGKHSTAKDATLFAGPIAQASLNISRKFMTTELSHPANIVQRIGRNNRFAEYNCATTTLLASKNQIKEHVRKFSTNGAVINTGAFKLKFTQDRIVSTNEAYYSQYSYEFFKALITKFSKNNEEPTTLTGNTITLTLNALNTFYLKYHIDATKKDSTLVNETREFIQDSIRCLQVLKLFKPVKLTIKTASNTEVRVSYRGASLWATMAHVSVSKIQTTVGHLIGLPSDRNHLVSINERDVADINLEQNLTITTEPEFKPLKQSAKYRAKYAGNRVSTHLLVLARSIDSPLVCSYSSNENDAGLYYISANNSQGKTLTLGFRKLKNGCRSLTLK
ncbi:CRISPR-associated endonuclease Cas3'' [Photobacterium sp. GB-27]|uniref:CRISPR-associated endonuclease Cas3'' n=1 Tax=Photobacterium sp. GB-27 TaxID=2022109 RepID=UPI000D17ACCE|nr:CRISPR-associated endonuclease Cas3'' [Photobacterium sp. GB-27]PSV30342.1 CRISPR-associated endonuclease Cas3'' [Photobacterium sp. GB-27]